MTGAYDLLFDRNDGLGDVLADVEGHVWYRDDPYVPFEDSGSAAVHYREGDLLPVLEHNLADVHRGSWANSSAVSSPRRTSSRRSSETRLGSRLSDSVPEERVMRGPSDVLNYLLGSGLGNILDMVRAGSNTHSGERSAE